jgi:hypothetical protein
MDMGVEIDLDLDPEDRHPTVPLTKVLADNTL